MKVAGRDGTGLLAGFLLEDMHRTSTLFTTVCTNNEVPLKAEFCLTNLPLTCPDLPPLPV